MKKNVLFKQILSALLCFVLVMGVFPTTLFAAKDRVTTIGSVSITGITVPKAGNFPDFTANADGSNYEVVKVIWQTAITLKEISETSRFNEALNYEVVVILKAKDSYKFAVSSGMPNVTATIDSKSANVGGVPNEPSMSDASKYIRVVMGFETEKADPIESITVNLKTPKHGELPAKSVTVNAVNGRENKGYVNVDDIVWKYQNGTALESSDTTFEYGKSYTIMLYLSPVGREFDDPEVTINDIKATVLPYTSNGGTAKNSIVAAVVFTCDAANEIDEIEISGLTVPEAGGFPSYIAIVGEEGVELADSHSSTTKNGITWIEAGSSAVPTSGFSFEAHTGYIVKLELEAENGYIFDDPKVTVNGRTAEVDGDEEKITVTYEFAPTGNNVIKSIGIDGIDAPKADALPDYTAELNNINAEFDSTVDRFTKNGVTWHDENKNSHMYVGTTKFEENGTYSVTIGIIANDGYEFSFDNGKSQLLATVNGKLAEVTARSEVEAYITYTFPKLEAHECSLKKVDAVKATCNEAGKEAYYSCSECGNNYEDAKGTTEITNINTWGVVPKLDHTGGKATCKEQAKCKVCGENYGELEEHSFGTTWGYTDALVHAHTCKVCGAPDASEGHTGGKATCKALAKCEKCRTEYGEYGSHKFNSKNKCTLCDYQLSFTDVNNTDYFIDAVAWAFDKGITTGMSADMFGPALTCTRGQVVTFLWRSAGKPEPQSKINPFTDVAETDYYYTAVLWALEKGITNGTSLTEFTPDQTCSTAHIITFLYRSVNSGADGWYEEAAKWAHENDLVETTGLAVNPETPCPRSAVVTFLHRFYG